MASLCPLHLRNQQRFQFQYTILISYVLQRSQSSSHNSRNCARHTSHVPRQPYSDIMAAAPIITNLPIERPDASGSYFSEPRVQAFLIKHLSWYRRHLTTAGRRESKSKSGANPSVVAECMGDRRERSASTKRGRKEMKIDSKKSLAELEQERRLSDCGSVSCCA
jgi:hypothetical protein